jgi:hypothetical protein
MVERHRDKKVLGRQTAPAAEQFRECARGRPGGLGDRLDARLRVEVLRDKGDRPPHGLIVVRRRRLLNPAPGPGEWFVAGSWAKPIRSPPLAPPDFASRPHGSRRDPHPEEPRKARRLEG